ncbi:MAG TPA: rRNA maturation RNase YbeY [Pyrinomonadaceae bacterium]|nr:rRNA maturation RNase YbeY [Pyrinomonadaceae bacterium]
MIEVVNRQRRRPMDNERWRQFAGKVLAKIGAGVEGAVIVFVSDRTMRGLNHKFRGLHYATDVLSFPAAQSEFEKLEGSNLGDVVISVERAAAQAVEHDLSFDNEVEQLILHGLLHLCGYDHEGDDGEMNRLELRLRRRLGI